MRLANKKSQSGFTLIELMIVVAIIAIIAAIAIPALVNSRKSANEAAAIGALRNMSYSQEQYRTRLGSYATLAELEAAAYLDDSFTAGVRQGYSYADALAPTTAAWAVRTAPTVPGTTGDRFSYVSNSGVIRFAEGVAADDSSAPVE